jgi:hypothetical protein
MSGPAFKRQVNLPGGVTVDRSVTTSQGPPGPTGPQGPQGIPGAAGGQPWVHIQSVPATPWNIAHNLGRHPSVTVQLDVGSGIWETVDMPVLYIDNNNVQVIPPVPLPGRADLS